MPKILLRKFTIITLSYDTRYLFNEMINGNTHFWHFRESNTNLNSTHKLIHSAQIQNHSIANSKLGLIIVGSKGE